MANKKRERSGPPDESIEMDMTPMIDIVFQMIMFFIIITDFTQKEIELLQLPWSTVGIEDEGDEKGRIIINILPPRSAATLRGIDNAKINEATDRIKVNGKMKTFVQLAEFLRANGVRNPRWRSKDDPRLSSRKVLVRCDELQAFDYVKGVLQVCSLPEVAIVDIEIATSEKLNPKKSPAKQ